MRPSDLPRPRLDPASTCRLPSQPYTHGAFLYVMEGADTPRYYPVLVDTLVGTLFTALQSVFSSDNVVLRARRRKEVAATDEVIIAMHETPTMT